MENRSSAGAQLITIERFDLQDHDFEFCPFKCVAKGSMQVIIIRANAFQAAISAFNEETLNIKRFNNDLVY